MASETTPLRALTLEPDPTDPRRWPVLALFCVAFGLQAGEWAFYSVIAHAVGPKYGWGTAEFTSTLSWANLAFVVTCPFWPFVVRKVGMKSSLAAASLLLLASNAIRLGATTHGNGAHRGIQFAAAVLNGLAAPPLGFAGPVLAQEWFPPGQRALATSLSAASGFVAAGLNSLVGPLAVPECEPLGAHAQGASPAADCGDVDQQVAALLWVHVVATALVFLAALALPSAPQHAPSESAEQQRQLRGQDNYRDVWQVVFLAPAAAVALLMGVPQAVFTNVFADLTPLLKTLNFSEQAAGNLGMALGFAGAAACVVMGLISDRLGGTSLKPLAGACYAAAFLAAVAFVVVVNQGPQAVTLGVAAAAILGPAMAASMPVFFEMAVEVAYPYSEEAVSAFLVWSVAAWQQVFFAIPPEAMNERAVITALPVCLGLALGFLVPFQVEYKRSLSDKA